MTESIVVTLRHDGTDRGSARIERAPLWWQARGLQQTASGYGRKLATEWVAVCTVMGLTVSRRRRRVYVSIFSNVGTAYLIYNGQEYILSDY